VKILKVKRKGIVIINHKIFNEGNIEKVILEIPNMTLMHYPFKNVSKSFNTFTGIHVLLVLIKSQLLCSIIKESLKFTSSGAILTFYRNPINTLFKVKILFFLRLKNLTLSHHYQS